MSRNKVLLTIGFIVVVAALYFYEYRDAFIRQPIQISHTFRLRMAMARRRPNVAATMPIIPTFLLGKDYKLTSVQVIRLEELKEKGFAHPLWEMVTDSNSQPTKTFFYGNRIPGMHAKVAGLDPEPLQTNVAYRVLVTAGREKGQHDFTITGEDAPPSAQPEASAN